MALEIMLHDDGTEFMELVKRCYREQPDKADLRELRKALETAPALYEKVFALATAVQNTLISKVTSGKTTALALTANVETMRQALGYEQAPIIEKMLIENILNAWLHYQHTEYHVTELIGSDSTFEVSRHWDRKLTNAQARYIRAIEALAKVRKLALPVLQVNINTDQGQQVNFAGDLVRGNPAG